MELEFESGRKIRSPKTADLMDLSSEVYAILSHASDRFLQCHQGEPLSGRFALEYREGKEEPLFQAEDEEVAFEVVLKVFERYLRGDPDWSQGFAWKEVKLSESRWTRYWKRFQA